MPFSYSDFLSKIATRARRRTRHPAPLFRAAGLPRSPEEPGAALAAAGAAATAICDRALHLTDAHVLESGAADSRPRAHEQNMELLLASLWRMTDDLALIREEFRQQPEPGVLGGAALGVPPYRADPGDEVRVDERASITAQVDAVENSICAIVAELTGHEEPPAGTAATAQFLDRVARHKAEVIRNSTDTINRLRLQAIQLAAAVQSYRASQSLACQAIDRIRNR